MTLDVSGGGTYASLTPFHIGEVGLDGGQTNNNNNNNIDGLDYLIVWEKAYCSSQLQR